MRNRKGSCLSRTKCIRPKDASTGLFFAHTSPYECTYDHVPNLLQQTEMDEEFARPSLTKIVQPGTDASEFHMPAHAC